MERKIKHGYAATDRNGKTHTRVSHRVYTHAVIIHYSAGTSQGKPWPARSDSQWSGTEVLAQAIARRYRGAGHEVEVIAARVD